MDSLNVFEEKELAKKRRVRPLWLILLLSSMLPGLGHFLLGKKRDGLGLILFGVLAGGVLGSSSYWEMGQIGWLSLRACTFLYLFAVVDASLLRSELRDGRAGLNPRPRLAFLQNYLGYGLGYVRRGDKAAGGVLIAFGILIHGLGGSVHVIVRIVAELLVFGVALHAFLGSGKPARATKKLELGELPSRMGADSTPSWLMPTLITFCTLHVLLLGASVVISRGILGAMSVDQSRALVVEPYYQNKLYGMELEMNAPGWSFADPSAEEFVSARHVSHDTSMRLIMRPRVMGLLSAETYAMMTLGTSMAMGYSLVMGEARDVRVGGLDGWGVRATGTKNGEPCQVEIITAGKGWRQYILWFEWGTRDPAFAQVELEYLLSNATLEGKAGPGSIESELAR